MRKFWIPFIIGILAMGAWAAWRWANQPSNGPVQAQVIVPQSSPAGFARASQPAALHFPLDFGPHPDFQTEWWYYTGNLDTTDGRHFGYQLTFFRRSIVGPGKNPLRASAWGTDQFYMAHFAITDVSGKHFQSYERLERGAAGLAGAQGIPVYQVWLDDWQVEQSKPGQYHLQASQNGESVDFILDDLVGPVLEGDHGYSQKGPEAGNASYYYSQPRLKTEGTIKISGQSFTVSGLSWMDHEFSTSAMSQGQVGWDWFALQFDDGSELMVYAVRRQDGSIDPYSSGTWIGPDGAAQPLRQQDTTISVLKSWYSGYSKVRYPAEWHIQAPGQGLDLQIATYLPDQEHHLSFVYWEGAVQISGSRNGKPIHGVGYVELTGYAGSMAGEF